MTGSSPFGWRWKQAERVRAAGRAVLAENVASVEIERHETSKSLTVWVVVRYKDGTDARRDLLGLIRTVDLTPTRADELVEYAEEMLKLHRRDTPMPARQQGEVRDAIEMTIKIAQGVIAGDWNSVPAFRVLREVESIEARLAEAKALARAYAR